MKANSLAGGLVLSLVVLGLNLYVSATEGVNGHLRHVVKNDADYVVPPPYNVFAGPKEAIPANTGYPYGYPRPPPPVTAATSISAAATTATGPSAGE